jgi:hypothetical protein
MDLMNVTRTDQMELGLAAKSRRFGRQAAVQKRRQRARWWFGQMRRAVDAAMEWRPSPPARPAQVYLELASKRS